ncbi:MAG TPA: dTDP-4-dehydrorhamnose reductase [Bauldia sp.]|nr:dTDP-4-dehydrorhamnose reductase [Bauldia sp.]
MILVFGAGGQLGQELAISAAATRTPLTGVGRDVDIADPRMVAGAIERTAASLVVNAAAFTRVDDAEREVAAAHRANVEGPAVVAAESARRDIPLIHISTDYIFDGEKGAPYLEDDEPNPLNRYGATKLAGEIAVRETHPRHLIIRSGWLFGAYGNNFLVRFLARAGQGERLGVVADRHGSPTAAVDLAEAILRIAPTLQSGRTGSPRGTYHFAGSERATWHELAAHALALRARLTGQSPELEAISSSALKAAALRPRDVTLDSRRFAAAFGFSARPWREGIERAVRQLVRSG